MWVIGDNFMSKSYRAHFLLRDHMLPTEEGTRDRFFIKEGFNFKNYCNSRYNSPNSNMLQQLQNMMAMALNKNPKLPKFILLILDDDLIMYLDFKGEEVSSMLGTWLSWLMEQFESLISQRRDLLPMKSKRQYELCMYWCAVPVHSGFNTRRNEIRKKFNLCLESICKGKQDVRVIKMKERWSFEDKALVMNDKITELGMDAYWDSVDCAFKFNAMKRDVFVAKLIAGNVFKGAVNKELHKEDKCMVHYEDEIPDFFRKHHHQKNDRFHWQRKTAVREDKSWSNREQCYLLPNLNTNNLTLTF